VKKESRAITNIQDQFLEDFEEVGRKRINKTKKYFQDLDESQIMTKLDEFIARQEVSTKNSLGKINASGRTILHAILGDAQQKRFEEQLRFLFKWCMDEHPELYRSKYTGDNNEAKTVLHLALRPAAKTESRYFVRFFVNNYPGEAAEILGAEKEDSLLLHHIMPFISDCDNVKFLTLFNSTDIDTDVEEDKHTVLNPRSFFEQKTLTVCLVRLQLFAIDFGDSEYKHYHFKQPEVRGVQSCRYCQSGPDQCPSQSRQRRKYCFAPCGTICAGIQYRRN